MACSPSTSSAGASSPGFSIRYWMSMPNWVPQSPMWWRPIVCSPVKSSMPRSASPMTADRRWPTCISLATFGWA